MGWIKRRIWRRFENMMQLRGGRWLNRPLWRMIATEFKIVLFVVFGIIYSGDVFMADVGGRPLSTGLPVTEGRAVVAWCNCSVDASSPR